MLVVENVCIGIEVKWVLVQLCIHIDNLLYKIIWPFSNEISI